MSYIYYVCVCTYRACRSLISVVTLEYLPQTSKSQFKPQTEPPKHGPTNKVVAGHSRAGQLLPYVLEKLVVAIYRIANKPEEPTNQLNCDHLGSSDLHTHNDTAISHPS